MQNKINSNQNANNDAASNSRRILIVDDSEINLEVLRELLADDYELESALSGEECLGKLMAFVPDLVLLDIMMPGINGYETCRRIKASPVGDLVQVILISGKVSTPERLEGYNVGADDYVIKPFDHDELLAKIRIHFKLRDSLVKLRTANSQIQKFNAELEELVARRTNEIFDTRDVAVFALAKLAESRDPETGEHLERIRQYSQILAEHLSKSSPYDKLITEKFLSDLYRSSPLHDIGKVGIPDCILQKPSRLTKEEYDIMTEHTTIGAEALREAAGRSASGSFLNMAVEIARSHHERYDGSGYPDGLAGEAIPLPARIVALADVFDALTSARVYKEALSPERAKEMIKQQRSQQFDPVVVDAFLARYEDFLAVMHHDTKALA